MWGGKGGTWTWEAEVEGSRAGKTGLHGRGTLSHKLEKEENREDRICNR